MNYSGLKQAARACLRDNGTVYRKLTFLFLLCLCAFTLLCDAVVWLSEAQLARMSGLSAMTGRNRLMLWGLVVSVAASLAISLWNVGYQALALCLSRKQPVSFRTFLTGFRYADRFLLLFLLEGLWIFLWSMFFMIPGIVAAYRYREAPFVMLDNPSLSPSEAIAVSKTLTYGHKLELFLLDLSFLWYILPLAAFSSLTLLPEYFQTPVFHKAGVQMVLYVFSLVLPSVLQFFFMPYVTATQAHAYNFLLGLYRAQRDTVSGGWRV